MPAKTRSKFAARFDKLEHFPLSFSAEAIFSARIENESRGSPKLSMGAGSAATELLISIMSLSCLGALGLLILT